MWLILPVQSDKEEKSSADLEDTRIPSDIIKDYRPFKSKDGIKRTIFYFKEAEKKKALVSPVPTEAIDKILGAAKIIVQHEELVD